MDYKELGFKCGIEIHNRLATEKKLFCNCPAKITDEEPSMIVKRKLRAVAGELGKVDRAAMFEALRGKEFHYQFFPSNCLIEVDDEPPRDMNQEALDIVLLLCKMTNANVSDEIHIMRKIVTDGSNTSAFQRTAIVGRDGCIETSKGKVRIENISVEEESAGIVEQKSNYAVYRLDRLGIPLVEIGTAPDIKDPEHAKEVAEKIGMLIRSTGKSQRGIGSIRQDVNVSIAGGTRIEIKGVQELGMVKDMIDNEVHRQHNLLSIAKQLHGVKFYEPREVTGYFENTKCLFIFQIIKKGGAVYAILLPKMNGLLKREICPGKTLGRELADYAVSHGCKGLIHTDEDMDKYDFIDEMDEVSILLNKKDSDAVVMIAGGPEALRAMDAIKARLELLVAGTIPKETRAANPDGTTRYTRPLPGSGRMYPETDLKPVTVDKKKLKEMKLPETLEDRAKKLSRKIPKDMADQILRSDYLEFFERNYEKYDAVLLANIIISLMKDLKRSGFKTDSITDDHLLQILDMVKKGSLVKEALPELLQHICENPSSDIKQALSKTGIKSMGDKELEKIVDDVFSKYPQLVAEKKMSALMGEVMKIVRGKIPGEKVSRVIAGKLK